MKYNYHTHTTRCGHASGSDREYVEKAIEGGFGLLGFTDHVPTPPYDPDFPQFRMPMSKAPEYCASLNALKEEFKDKIEIHVGFECEYIPFVFDEHVRMLREAGCEYLILSQHFIFTDDPNDPYPGYGGTDDPARLHQYVDLVLEGAETGKFTYIAHPDIYRYTGPDEDYQKEYRRLCDGAKSLNIPLEFNYLGYHDRRHYASDRFFEIARKVGNEVIIGYDAHNPDVFTDTAAIDAAIEHVRSLGVNLIEQVTLRQI